MRFHSFVKNKVLQVDYGGRGMEEVQLESVLEKIEEPTWSA
jgi:hypothetical protein